MPSQTYIKEFVSNIYLRYTNKTINDSEVNFDVATSFDIIINATKIFLNEPSVLQINTKLIKSDFVIVGDIHGSLDSLIKIFESIGNPRTTQYLFLGDYVDRGQHSCEVIMLLYSLKCLYPDNIHLIRGNHEFADITELYGFKDECFSRVKIRKENGKKCSKGKRFYYLITESFKHLPICAIVNNSIFCVHGGVTALINNREELMKIKKVGKKTSSCNLIQNEFLWNDPCCSVLKYEESQRGIGCIFGKEALNSFLENLKFDLVIRGHQKEDEGFNWPFGEFGGILTVFSSIDYCGDDNHGGVAVISNNDDICDKSDVEIVQLKKDSKGLFGFNSCQLLKTFMEIVLIYCIFSFLSS